jgi:hypothetical protein
MTEGPEPSLPTYKTAAEVLERDKGSGVRLLGWTVARTVMIAPPFLLVGVPWKKALAGAALSSTFISLFTLLRIYNARMTGLEGIKRPAFPQFRKMPRLAAAPRR